MDHRRKKNGAPSSDGAPHGQASSGGLSRKNDRVDHMDHAVAGSDIRLNDIGAVNRDTPGGGIDGHRLALNGGRLDPLAGQIAGHHPGGKNVVGQDGHQLILVFRLQKVGDGAFGKLGKGIVGRREHREGAGAFQDIDQTGGLNGRHQGGEAFVASSDIDDILRCGTMTGGLCGLRQDKKAKGKRNGKSKGRDAGKDACLRCHGKEPF